MTAAPPTDDDAILAVRIALEQAECNAAALQRQIVRSSLADGAVAHVAALRFALARLEASRPDPHRAGYDVGAGTVREGDAAMFEGRKCKVLTVYHDGDVQIELSTYPTVKWRQVTPSPPPPARIPKMNKDNDSSVFDGGVQDTAVSWRKGSKRNQRRSDSGPTYLGRERCKECAP